MFDVLNVARSTVLWMFYVLFDIVRILCSFALENFLWMNKNPPCMHYIWIFYTFVGNFEIQSCTGKNIWSVQSVMVSEYVIFDFQKYEKLLSNYNILYYCRKCLIYDRLVIEACTQWEIIFS